MMTLGKHMPTLTMASLTAKYKEGLLYSIHLLHIPVLHQEKKMLNPNTKQEQPVPNEHGLLQANIDGFMRAITQHD